MKSGDPQPNDDLKILVGTKQHGSSRTIDIISDAARWLKAALKGADVRFAYASCEEDHYGYAAITIIRSYRGNPTSLDIKIAEIRERPYVFAEVRSLGKREGTLFPFFGDLQSEDHRDLLLHYIADFIVSTDA